jgi:hypothetical protein
LQSTKQLPDPDIDRKIKFDVIHDYSDVSTQSGLTTLQEELDRANTVLDHLGTRNESLARDVITQRNVLPPPLRPTDRTKKERTAAAIVRDMNKVTTMSTFPILEYNADTLKRQNGFQLYIRALQNVLMNIEELSTVLVDFPRIKPVANPHAARALFSFVQSTVSPGYYAHLDLFVKEHGLHDGSAALQSLQQLCLSQDPTLQQMALRNYEHIMLGEDQKIISFNQFFNRAYTLVTARGIELTQKMQMRTYFNAVGGTHNSQLSGIIALYRHQFQNDMLTMSVYEMQSVLQQEEEQITMQDQMHSKPNLTQQIRPIRNKPTNSTSSANAVAAQPGRGNGNQNSTDT